METSWLNHGGAEPSQGDDGCHEDSESEDHGETYSVEDSTRSTVGEKTGNL